MTESVKRRLDRRGGAVIVNSDFCKPFHPEYSRLLAEDDRNAALCTSLDGRRWMAIAEQYLIEARSDVIIETTMRDPSDFVEPAKMFRAAGYHVEAAIMAVPESLNRLGIEYIRPGDALTVVSLDRLGRSLEDLITIVGRLKRLNVGFLSPHEKLDTTTPGGIFVFHVFAALAEFIRTIIVADTNEGRAAARAAGQRLGRPLAMTPEKIAYALHLLGEPDRTMTSIAKLLGVSRSTLYTALPELQAAKRDRGGLDGVLAQLPSDSRPGPSTVDSYDALLTGTGR
ncbi:zeta toxin family protein [Actinoplanes regularis]|uniref:UDP-N-acetylglucosamine kinase n=1 Tax=Actinoplanes regularis TaxID=52697 RepID=A0A239IB17_9ACTN|nr:zeta toxin family protein [Actinoplanes regularis]GIE90760.1 hypothetical protein Are01nite_72400 [Actinoplanes regularis]SNS90996.1 Helix-turn-helix domain of resolvase [Actinoplanes regularis]